MAEEKTSDKPKTGATHKPSEKVTTRDDGHFADDAPNDPLFQPPAKG